MLDEFEREVVSFAGKNEPVDAKVLVEKLGIPQAGAFF
jgi:hypothetical protein